MWKKSRGLNTFPKALYKTRGPHFLQNNIIVWGKTVASQPCSQPCTLPHCKPDPRLLAVPRDVEMRCDSLMSQLGPELSPYTNTHRATPCQFPYRTTDHTIRQCNQWKSRLPYSTGFSPEMAPMIRSYHDHMNRKTNI